VVALLVAYAAASQARFEVGTGLFLPTGLIFVPMLFLLPLGWVPAAICAGLLLDPPRICCAAACRSMPHPDRPRLNSWYSIGPVPCWRSRAKRATHALRLAALRRPPRLVAQCSVDYGIQSAAPVVRLRPAVLGGSALHGRGRILVEGRAAHRSACWLRWWRTTSRGAHVRACLLVALLFIFARERQSGSTMRSSSRTAYRGTALLLGDVVEADDAYTGLHSRDVVSLVLDVCDELGVEGARAPRRGVRGAAARRRQDQDPSEIINKPGKLTDDEFELIKTHTVEGERLLSQVGGLLGNVGHIVRSCHEDWDGTGYPDGLRGEQIPLVARIVRCCDAFSAMTTDRSYRKALPVDEGRRGAAQLLGHRLRPEVVAALVKTVQA
jgi:hypothetical protein